ncbi:MAG: amidohydrolase family protein [Syntrophales bacterium]|nr:amidohydrolase family protein [Syntrophales bacterium]MDD5233705.1 amidohydrolase family protein [Syntrophales bacterium]MDD5531793.1 amidohydrolase family protein [Syntrophales bacterium]
MRAIDTHVHPGTREDVIDTGGKYIEHAASYFGLKMEILSEEALADRYRKLDLMGVLLAWDAETNTGLPRLSNEYVARLAAKYPDTFIGFGSVDPWKGQIAVKEAEHAVRDLGLRGIKFQQASQAFFPDDRRFYPLWETIAGLGVPVLFHTGTTGYGAGVPGGDGIRLKYTRPIPHLDDLAADMPGLTIICAHPSWPWQDEMLAVAMHKANVYIDLSGWSPKYFPPLLVQYANSFLQDKCLFGSDHPYIKPDRWLSDFDKLPLKPEVKEKILLGNAKRLLKI